MKAEKKWKSSRVKIAPMDNEKNIPLSTREIALDLLDSNERRELTVELLDELLPSLAADIENLLFAQGAKVGYELFIKNDAPKLKVVLHLKKFAHEFIVHLDSHTSQFIVGSERGGAPASNALEVSRLLKTMLSKFKT